MGGGGQGCLAIEAEFLSGSGERVQCMVAMAGRVSHGEGVDLALGNVVDGSYLREQVPYFTTGGWGESAVEGQRGKTAPAARHGAGHGACPAYGTTHPCA